MGALFSFRGRTSRLGYWRINLLCIALVCGLWVLGLFAMLAIGPNGAIVFILAPAIYLISIATWVRRLHDRGKGLWWALLFVLGPVVCGAIAEMLQNQYAGQVNPESGVFSLATVVILGWAFIELGFFPGQPGPNRFGDPPVR